MHPLDGFIPDARTLALVGPAAAVYGAACAWLAGWLRCSRGVRAPYTRKIFHFTIFSMAVAVHLAFGTAGVVVYGSVLALLVLYATMRGDGYPFYEAMARPTDAPRRTLFILVPLATTALGGAIDNLLFGDFAMVGYLVAGWGDAVGEPVGTRWGRHRYRVPSLAGVPATRSIEGSAAVFLCGSIAATLVLLAWGHDPRSAIAAGFAAGAAGALVEAFSTHGLDNLTVQVAATAVAAAILRG